jgi:hypothetical protein
MTEDYKGAWHLVMFGGAFVCLAYNAGEWCARKEWRLAFNVAIYTAAVLFEAKNVKGHFSECRD